MLKFISKIEGIANFLRKVGDTIKVSAKAFEVLKELQDIWGKPKTTTETITDEVTN